MKKLIIILPLIITGCAKVGDYQASCEQHFSKLSEMATCLDINIKSDSRLSSASTPKLYVLAAKKLGHEVDQGKISDAQARLELQSFYVKLQRQEITAQQAQALVAQQRMLNTQTINTLQAVEQKARQPVIMQPYPTRVETTTRCTNGFYNSVDCKSSSSIR